MLIEYTQTDPFTGEEITTATDADFLIADIIHFDDVYRNNEEETNNEKNKAKSLR